MQRKTVMSKIKVALLFVFTTIVIFGMFFIFKLAIDNSPTDILSEEICEFVSKSIANNPIGRESEVRYITIVRNLNGQTFEAIMNENISLVKGEKIIVRKIKTKNNNEFYVVIGKY